MEKVSGGVSLFLHVDSIVFGHLVCEVREKWDSHWSDSTLFPWCVDPVCMEMPNNVTFTHRQESESHPCPNMSKKEWGTHEYIYFDQV